MKEAGPAIELVHQVKGGVLPVGHQAGEDYFGDIDGKTLVETAVLRQIAEEILSGDGVNDLSAIRLQ